MKRRDFLKLVGAAIVSPALPAAKVSKDGYIDHVVMWDRALSPDEVKIVSLRDGLGGVWLPDKFGPAITAITVEGINDYGTFTMDLVDTEYGFCEWLPTRKS